MSETETGKKVDETLSPPLSEGEDEAPGSLELVRAFVNSRELDPEREVEPEREDLTDPAALREWLLGHGVIAPKPLDEADLERAKAFREALRALLLANNGEPLDRDAVARLQRIAAEAPVRLEVGPDGGIDMACSAEGVDSLVAEVLTAISSAQETGEWSRLKACRSDECLWAFYDRSRNHSRHWCSMRICGNRAKTRTYRAKH